ncbi:MAG: phosphodiesterase [Rhodobacteraceae bacterium]|nr:phosphodiesterase [Paracoccaceae bacterium]
MTPLPPEFLTRPLAHRTLHDLRAGRPENSLAGARAAIVAGYGIEVDLQLSQDGVPMVFHDYVLNRLTPEVGDVNYRKRAELQDIRLTWGTEPIPTLEDLLKAVNGRTPLLIEMKDQSGNLDDTESGMEQAVCEHLSGYTGAVALMSRNPHMVARCADLAPDIPRGLVTGTFTSEDRTNIPPERLKELADIADYDRAGAGFISHNAHDLGTPRVAEIARIGAILCWTVRSAAQEAKVRMIAQNITFEGYPAEIPDMSCPDMSCPDMSCPDMS